MRTVDERRIAAPPERVFAAARDVQRWPALLAHYRWVRLLEPRQDGGIVEMSANRPFGPLNWPTWWVSEMWVDANRLEVRYRHIRGMTTGMTDLALDHRWDLVDAVSRSPLLGLPEMPAGIELADVEKALREADGLSAAERERLIASLRELASVYVQLAR